jgi:hypothetical protein
VVIAFFLQMSLVPGPKDLKTCDSCGYVGLKKNFWRHAKKHQEDVGETTQLRCRSVTLVDPCQYSPASSSVDGYDPERPAMLFGGNQGESEARFRRPRAPSGVADPAVLEGGVRSNSSQPLVVDSAPTDPRRVQAVRRLLEHHERYNIPDLIEILDVEFPGLSPDMRSGLVIGAVFGAQKASQLHFLWDAYRGADELSGRRLADNAMRSLAAWNVGPREESVFKALSTEAVNLSSSGPVSIAAAPVDLGSLNLFSMEPGPPDKSVLGDELTVELSTHAMLIDLDMPVAYEVSNEEFENLYRMEEKRQAGEKLRREEERMDGETRTLEAEKRKLEDDRRRLEQEEERRLEEEKKRQGEADENRKLEQAKTKAVENRRPSQEEEERRPAVAGTRSVQEETRRAVKRKQEQEHSREEERRRLARERRRREDVIPEGRQRRAAEERRRRQDEEKTSKGVPASGLQLNSIVLSDQEMTDFRRFQASLINKRCFKK